MLREIASAATRSLSIVTAQKRTARRPFQALAAASPPPSFVSDAAHGFKPRLGIGPHIQKGCDRSRVVGDVGFFSKSADRAREPESIGVDQTPPAPDPPMIGKQPVRHALGARCAAENHRLEDAETSIFGHVRHRGGGTSLA